MKIGIGINYWDDPEGLMRLLSSLPLEIIYKIYIIDGSYAGRDGEPHYKQEMTEAIIHSCNTNIHYVKMFGVKQIDKRNRYFEFAQEDDIDWLIVVDSDEYIIVDNNELFLNALVSVKLQFPNARCFPVANNNLGHFFPTPRLFAKPFDYRHIQQVGKISHGSLYDPNGKEIVDEMYQYYNHMRKVIGSDGNDACVSHILMVHDKSLRTKERLDSDYVYYNDNPER